MIWDIIVALGDLPVVKEIGHFFHLWPDNELESLCRQPKIQTIELEKYNLLQTEKNNLKRIIYNLKVKNNNLTNVNTNLIKANDDLKVLVEKYEGALVKRNNENIELIRVLDTHKETINSLMLEKYNLNKLLDLKEEEVKILKSKVAGYRNVVTRLKLEIKDLKKD